jgi:hypothetical protein
VGEVRAARSPGSLRAGARGCAASRAALWWCATVSTSASESVRLTSLMHVHPPALVLEQTNLLACHRARARLVSRSGGVRRRRPGFHLDRAPCPSPRTGSMGRWLGVERSDRPSTTRLVSRSRDARPPLVVHEVAAFTVEVEPALPNGPECPTPWYCSIDRGSPVTQAVLVHPGVTTISTQPACSAATFAAAASASRPPATSRRSSSRCDATCSRRTPPE